jgi:hypothetical protein
MSVSDDACSDSMKKPSVKKQDGFRYTIHPKTVIVPNNSLKGDYVMEEREERSRSSVMFLPGPTV